MQDSSDRPQAASDAATPAPTDEDWGWYLYGITRREQRASDDTHAEAFAGISGETDGNDDSRPLETISSGELLAIARRVPLADFSAEALSARAEDPAWIELMARRHNEVIARIHQTRAILPAKFGSVYANAEDVRTALAEERESLLARLSWIDGCDEWGVRLYGNLAVIRSRADTEDDSVRRLREELASASPGRAYFLQRKLADALSSALDRLLDTLIQQAYEHFLQHARAGQISRQIASSRINLDEESAELVRAAFLVPRESADAFIEDVSAFSESQSGLRCEYSGPWPPYSFAARTEPTDSEEE